MATCSGSNKLDHDYALGGGVAIRGRGFTFENEVSIIVPFAMPELVLYLDNGVIGVFSRNQPKLSLCFVVAIAVLLGLLRLCPFKNSIRKTPFPPDDSSSVRLLLVRHVKRIATTMIDGNKASSLIFLLLAPFNSLRGREATILCFVVEPTRHLLSSDSPMRHQID